LTVTAAILHTNALHGGTLGQRPDALQHFAGGAQSQGVVVAIEGAAQRGNGDRRQIVQRGQGIARPPVLAQTGQQRPKLVVALPGSQRARQRPHRPRHFLPVAPFSQQPDRPADAQLMHGPVTLPRRSSSHPGAANGTRLRGSC